MLRIGTALALLSGSATLAAFNFASAQAPVGSTAATPEAYRPTFGDLMTILIQPHHTKLGLAGDEQNWAYAGYEFRELQSAFSRMAAIVPTYRSANTADLISATTKAPMEDVGAAIKAGDSAKFGEAYMQLTATCNACHQSTDHGAIVIQVPKSSSYPDQDFRPLKP